MTQKDIRNLFGRSVKLDIVADGAIGKLMHDFFEADSTKMYYSEIAENVRFHKQEETGVTTMCRIFEEYDDERARIAREEGRAEAIAEKSFEVAEDLLRDGSLSMERISAERHSTSPTSVKKQSPKTTATPKSTAAGASK